MKRNYKLIIALILSALFAGCSQDSKGYTIGSASEGSNYYNMAAEIAETVREEDSSLSFEVATSAGSDDNIRNVAARKNTLAIVQADILHYALSGEGMFSGDPSYKDLKAVTALYPEAIQLVARNDGFTHDMKSLRNQVIGVGSEGSGTEQNAFNILLAYGLNETTVQTVNMSLSESCQALKDGTINAFFYTSAAPAKDIENLAQEIDICLIPIDGEVQEQLLDQYDYYLDYEIRSKTYHGVNDDVATIGVMSVLIANEKTDDDIIYKVTKAIFDDPKRIEHAIDMPFSFSSNQNTDDIPIPYHNGALRWYREHGIDIAE